MEAHIIISIYFIFRVSRVNLVLHLHIRQLYCSGVALSYVRRVKEGFRYVSRVLLNGKQTWLAVLNKGLNPRLGLSSEFNPPILILHRGEIRKIEKKMGRWRDAGEIVTETEQWLLLIYTHNDD